MPNLQTLAPGPTIGNDTKSTRARPTHPVDLLTRRSPRDCPRRQMSDGRVDKRVGRIPNVADGRSADAAPAGHHGAKARAAKAPEGHKDRQSCAQEGLVVSNPETDVVGPPPLRPLTATRPKIRFLRLKGARSVLRVCCLDVGDAHGRAPRSPGGQCPTGDVTGGGTIR